MSSPFKPARPDIYDIAADLKRRLRALEAWAPNSCAQWTELDPTLTLDGGTADPTGYTARQLDETCETGLGSPGTWYVHGDLQVVLGSDPGTGDDSSFYQLNTFPHIGGVTESLGYGYCMQHGGTIAYPAMLMSNGGFLILGVDDTGGGVTPGFARPDFPFTFGDRDVLFDGHYAYWGKQSL